MAAPASHPAFPRDAWPTIELKRVPNGEMGVLMQFPATPEMVKLGVDVLGFLVEPRRVETMHSNIADILDALGLVKTPLRPNPSIKNAVDEALRLKDLARRAIGFSQHAAICNTNNRDWRGLCSCGLDGLRKEIEGAT